MLYPNGRDALGARLNLARQLEKRPYLSTLSPLAPCTSRAMSPSLSLSSRSSRLSPAGAARIKPCVSAFFARSRARPPVIRVSSVTHARLWARRFHPARTAAAKHQQQLILSGAPRNSSENNSSSSRLFTREGERGREREWVREPAVYL